MGAYGGTSEASKGEDATIYHVDKSIGSDWNTGLSRSDAFKTIQKAVDTAYEGDVIMVWPGTYSEKVLFDRWSITIQSADDAAVIEAPNDYAFSFYHAQTSNCVVRNFVITGSEVGIYCEGASPTLANLTIADNKFGIRGWGGADPYIVNCIFWDNEYGDLSHCDARYSFLADATGIGNFSDSNGPGFADADRDDYHLLSRNGRYSPNTKTWEFDSVTSPCIDRGDPRLEIGREQKPHGGQINMGAYGGTPFASRSSF
jgi:hypothetical protein